MTHAAAGRSTASTITDDQLDRLHARLAAVGDLHSPIADPAWAAFCCTHDGAHKHLCATCRTCHPCPTMQALDGSEGPAHVAGDPDQCPACRLLPASQVPAILCPGPAKERS
ncbi:hypothetical protein K378_01395 [Streptomyces sp. Amel2xB2]|uniref:hypothetical protein n=1 Tax=Streptomyces sp. Amel2xB2 TaxID=1305829 RepID=UPI000DBA85CC|nr:hypothetical protein [Streptomyces sp. Amel2xB2]RAJ70230.1 hypothetical protein K378_01395 [Streptomyces sp. Amel2xB2]